jgi:hypothetical protein
MSSYAMLDEAYNESPVMVQDPTGIFIENDTKKYQKGSYQKYFESPKKYNFEEKPEKKTESIDYKSTEKFQELQQYVKDLESQIKGLKLNQLEKKQSLFGDTNSNEMIIFISFGILVIMVLDSFSKLGAKFGRK